MNEQLISFETAKLAKEKGFKLGSGWQIRSLFNIKDGETFCEKTIETPEYACERCTQSLLQKWLREVHNFHITINVDLPHNQFIMYYSNVIKFGKHHKSKFKSEFYKTYEEALEKGLQEALKLIKLI